MIFSQLEGNDNNPYCRKIISIKGEKGYYYFDKNAILGKGKFGQTYIGDTENHTKVIIKNKKIQQKPYNFFIFDLIQREFLLLSSLKHENVTRMIDFFYPKMYESNFINESYIIKEYGDTNLKELINNYYKNGMSEIMIKDFLRQILNGLIYLHINKKLIHGNLKPENIIIFISSVKNSKKTLCKYVLKMTDIDIDSNKMLPLKEWSNDHNTLLYTAPEVLVEIPYNTSSIDIWSLGCIFYEMVTGHVLINEKANDRFRIIENIFSSRYNEIPSIEKWQELYYSSIKRIFYNIKKLNNSPLYCIDKYLTSFYTKLITNMLMLNPMDRITALSALRYLCNKTSILNTTRKSKFGSLNDNSQEIYYPPLSCENVHKKQNFMNIPQHMSFRPNFELNYNDNYNQCNINDLMNKNGHKCKESPIDKSSKTSVCKEIINYKSNNQNSLNTNISNNIIKNNEISVSSINTTNNNSGMKATKYTNLKKITKKNNGQLNNVNITKNESKENQEHNIKVKNSGENKNAKKRKNQEYNKNVNSKSEKKNIKKRKN